MSLLQFPKVNQRRNVPRRRCALNHTPKIANVLTKPFFFFQVIAALSVSLVSMVVGFVSAYTSPAAESMKEDLDLSDEKVKNPLQFPRIRD